MRVYTDTNTLYPFYLYDLLLRCAEEDLFDILWTEYLLAELLDVLPRSGHKSRAAVEGLCEAIRQAFPAGEVTEADEFLCEQFTHYPDDLMRILRNQAADLTRPRLTLHQLLDCLDHPTGTPRLANLVRKHLSQSPLLGALPRSCRLPPDRHHGCGYAPAYPHLSTTCLRAVERQSV